MHIGNQISNKKNHGNIIPVDLMDNPPEAWITSG